MTCIQEYLAYSYDSYVPTHITGIDFMYSRYFMRDALCASRGWYFTGYSTCQVPPNLYAYIWNTRHQVQLLYISRGSRLIVPLLSTAMILLILTV